MEKAIDFIAIKAVQFVQTIHNLFICPKQVDVLYNENNRENEANGNSPHKKPASTQ